MKRAVFLDRDGVLNRNILRGVQTYAPTNLAEFEILPGLSEAVRKLHNSGFLTIVVTNQPDVATGIQSLETVAKMHELLNNSMPLDGFNVCYRGP